MVTDPNNDRQRRISLRDRVAISSTVITVAGLIATFGAAVKWR